MDNITKYFNAEKNESLLFILVGVAAIACALYFVLSLKLPFFNGMAMSLMTIALIQLTVGTTVYLKSPKDLQRVQQMNQSAQHEIRTIEIPRMKTVMANFVTYKWIEIVLLVAAVIMFLYFDPATLPKGLALGLMIQAAFMLLLDFFAEQRGKDYIGFLNGLA